MRFWLALHFATQLLDQSVRMLVCEYFVRSKRPRAHIWSAFLHGFAWKQCRYNLSVLYENAIRWSKRKNKKRVNTACKSNKSAWKTEAQDCNQWCALAQSLLSRCYATAPEKENETCHNIKSATHTFFHISLFFLQLSLLLF